MHKSNKMTEEVRHVPQPRVHHRKPPTPQPMHAINPVKALVTARDIEAYIPMECRDRVMDEKEIHNLSQLIAQLNAN